MVHVPPFRRVAYEALSLTWGLPITSCIICVDGNLYQSEIPLIDALCINQVDDEEKSLQLQRMRFIYQRASEVIVWLDEQADHSRLAMQLISDLPPNTFSAGLIGSDEQNLGLYHLAQHQYWNRCWCMQEMTSASKDPIQVCDDQQVCLTQFYHRCRDLAKFWKAGLSSLKETIGGSTKLGIENMFAIW
jgi:hypothetical protein